MDKARDFRAILRGLLVIVAAALLYVCPVEAAVVPAENPDVQTQYNGDPNINTTCDNSVFNEQYNSVGQYVKSVQLAVTSDKGMDDAMRLADERNQRMNSYYFCPLKITTLNLTMASFSAIAAGIMAAVIAALQAIVVNLINTILNTICAALVSALNWIGSLLCIPSIPTISLNMPNFSFPSGPVANNCSGMKLFSVTGGPPLVSPPLNYGVTIPGTNWQGRVNVIR